MSVVLSSYAWIEVASSGQRGHAWCVSAKLTEAPVFDYASKACETGISTKRIRSVCLTTNQIACRSVRVASHNHSDVPKLGRTRVFHVVGETSLHRCDLFARHCGWCLLDNRRCASCQKKHGCEPSRIVHNATPHGLGINAQSVASLMARGHANNPHAPRVNQRGVA